MIVKKIKNQKSSKPKTKQIADLVDYIRHPHDTNPEEKIEHSGGRNFLSGSHTSQKKEMTSLATETVYSKMPVSHYVFSWREHEQPTAAQVDELVDIFLREMGLEGCQTVYGLHYNTENYHVHIAVNRMHPVTMKVIDPNNGFDIEAAHKVLALVEHRQGWTPEKNARYVVNEQGDIVRRPRPERIKPKQPALDFECATGEKSAQRIAQERGHAIIQNAQSWPELHEKLGAAGLRFEQKGSGAIIFVGEIAVKASSVDRAFSMGKLCKRLGEFIPGAYSEEKVKVEPEPVSSVNLEEWKRYRAATAPPTGMVMEDPNMGLLRVRQRKERETLPSKLRQHLPHPPLGAPPGPVSTCPRCILNIGRHLQKLQHTEERRQLRHQLRKRLRKRPRFEDWLRAQGMQRQADQWRYRKALEALPPALWETPDLPTGQKYDPVKAYAAHKQAILKDTPDMAPSHLDVYIALNMRNKGFTREAVQETIFRCAQEEQPSQPERDWQRYAERATTCAFGIAGDMVLARATAAREQAKQEQEKREDEARQEDARTEAPRMRMR